MTDDDTTRYDAGVIPLHHGPIQTVTRHRGTPGRPTTVIIRRMPTALARACRLCPREYCNHRPGPDGQGICLQEVPGTLTDREAHTYVLSPPAVRASGSSSSSASAASSAGGYAPRSIGPPCAL